MAQVGGIRSGLKYGALLMMEFPLDTSFHSVRLTALGGWQHQAPLVAVVVTEWLIGTLSRGIPLGRNDQQGQRGIPAHPAHIGTHAHKETH